MDSYDSLAGTVVDGRYAVQARVARGGMATVYRAHDRRLERTVALKIMHPFLAEQPEFIQRFHSEARAAARLSHPHVVGVYDEGMWHGPEGDAAYLAMEFVPGPDLRGELRRFGSFNLSTVLELLDQVLDGLSAAHAAGLVHRDVKPENTLLVAPLPPTSAVRPEEITAKVTDFGLARAIHSATRTSTMMGTVAYLAPELIDSSDAASPASDLYAVGVMAYEMITGTLPFQGETAISIAFQHLNAAFPRAAEVADWLPPALDSFIGLLTAKRPQDRPRDALEARTILSSLRGDIDEDLLVRRVPVIPGFAALNPEPTQVVSSPGDEAAARGVVVPDATRLRDGEAADPTVPAVGPAVESAPAQAFASPETSARQRAALLPPTEQATIVRAPERNLTARATAVARRPRRTWPWAVALVVLIAGLAVAAWWFLAGPGLRVAVPNVAGQPEAAAQSTLADAGFTTRSTHQFSDTVPRGAVVGTDPAAGAQIHPSQPVTMRVSDGVEMVEVPDLTNISAEDAASRLRDARLTSTRTEEYSDSVPQGVVISQSQPAGTKVPHDSSIAIAVSMGPQPITVPNMSTQPRENAERTLTQAGFRVNVTETYSDDVPRGEVISQSPDGGTLPRGDTVTLNVSKGPEPVDVPHVVGMDFDAAKQKLEGAGFKVKRNDVLGGVLGLVQGQSPSGKQAPGTTITLTVV